jgi:glutathione synthase/RimK-type ligase-like ATP-grasp enzyme
VTVLVLTETSDLAADLIILELRRRGIEFWRLNSDTFPDECEITRSFGPSSIVFRSGTAQFSSEDVDAAWSRHAPRVAHPDPYVDQETHTFLAGLWQEMPWKWVNKPSAVAVAGNKLWQLRVAAEIGLDTPATVVTNRVQSVVDMFGSRPVVVKTIGGAGIERDGTRQNLYAQLHSLSAKDAAAVHAAPCIFQESAKPGTDVRVTVTGDRVFATDIVVAEAFTDWRSAPPSDVRYKAIDLPGETAGHCLRLCRIAGLSYAAFDFVRQPTGRYVFLEVNPSGQWGWLEHATGQPITSAIVDTLTSSRDGI